MRKSLRSLAAIVAGLGLAAFQGGQSVLPFMRDGMKRPTKLARQRRKAGMPGAKLARNAAKGQIGIGHPR